jgi:uncharacterized protein
MDVPGIEWEQRPELRYPSLFAAWPGMGNVAFNAARYLIDKLGMEPLGRIDSGPFVLAEGILVQNQKILPLRMPEYRFYFHRHPSERGDVIVFVGDSQPPPHLGYTLARLVIKAAEAWGVQKIYTGAALACSISHMETPRVWGVATHPDVWSDLGRAEIRLLEEGQISGLNGLLLGVAKQAGFEGVCLLGEVPYYTIGTDNPKSTQAVLESLCEFWDIRLDFSELRSEAVRKEMEIEEFIRQGENDTAVQEMLEKAGKEPEVPQ